MHANLRILYVLIALTMVTAGVWWFQGGQGNLAQIKGTDFAIADTSTVDKIFIADMDGGQVTLTRPTQGRCGTSMANSKPVRTPSTCC